MKVLKIREIGGRNYIPVTGDIVLTPHALYRAEERGVRREELWKKIKEEKELLKDHIANTLGKGQVRGFFYLTFPGERRGKVLWELMNSQGKRFETVEEVEETTDILIVVYTYLDQKQRWYNETSSSVKRRERDNRKVF